VRSTSRSPRSPPASRGALHGLRHSLLPRRLSSRQSHPRMERPGLARSVGRSLRTPARHQQLPEFTGRLCPAPCEGACVLGINAEPVAIERVEYEIAERAFAENWVVPQIPEVRTGKSVAVVGSARQGWPVRSSWRGPDMTWSSTSEPSGRWLTALRHPRIQDGEGRSRSPSGPARGRGGHLPLLHGRRCGTRRRRRCRLPVRPD